MNRRRPIMQHGGCCDRSKCAEAIVLFSDPDAYTGAARANIVSLSAMSFVGAQSRQNVVEVGGADVEARGPRIAEVRLDTREALRERRALCLEIESLEFVVVKERPPIAASPSLEHRGSRGLKMSELCNGARGGLASVSGERPVGRDSLDDRGRAGLETRHTDRIRRAAVISRVCGWVPPSNRTTPEKRRPLRMQRLPRWPFRRISRTCTKRTEKVTRMQVLSEP